MSGPDLPKRIFGYDVVERLGEGALSSIYVVSDPKTNQLRALKHVVPTEEKHGRFITQLETEFNVSRTFRHPGLRKCLDLKVRKKLLFGPVAEAALVMELVDGTPLERAVPETVPEIVDVFVRVANAMAAVHHYNYLHCDTKPSNILRTTENIGADDSVKLIDFGQACQVGTSKERVQGTPDFIAPEQVRCKPLGFYTDVYNLGATLYWALTRRRVPTLLTVAKDQRDVVREQAFPKPHELNPAVPGGLSELVMDCVRHQAGFRPQSMAEVLSRLVPFGTGKVK
ncbi:MAG TPA: serine/threonine-protein kinase [Humisphaera sp.]